MSINLGCLLVSSLIVWKVVDIIRWALSADWKAILKDWFN